MFHSQETTMIRHAALAGLLIAAPVMGFAATAHFHATLNGNTEVPATSSTGAGTLEATLDTTTMALDYTLTWSGLTGPATMAHFHGPAAPGKNAGVQVVIGGTGPSSPVHATATLTADQMAQLDHGMWYVNVHSKKFPKGEIRGQVAKQ
jgi:hypothetical protein